MRTGLASALVAIAGAIGITKASVLLTVRGRVDQWSELLWNRALAQKVVEATLTLDVVLPPPVRERRIGAAVPERVGRRFRRPAAARPAAGALMSVPAGAGRPRSNSSATSSAGIGRA